MPLRFRGKLVFVPLATAVTLYAASNRMPLAEAAKNDDLTTVQSLLRQHADVNAPGVDGSTALLWAAYQDDLQLAELLLRSDADPKAANRYGMTPLSAACTNGNAAIIELLLKAGADVNAPLPGGETPLMTAARTGKVDAVKTLLARSAQVNAKEEMSGQTALMWAAADGNTETVEELIARGADIRARSKGGFTPLLFAVREGRIGAARSLLHAGADVNDTWKVSRGMGAGSSALVIAVANAHYELASVLLDAGADPNASAQGWTALHEVTWVRKPGTGTNNPAPPGSGSLDSLDLVRRLIAHGANVNARMTRRGNAGYTVINMIGATPFLMAARTADVPLMRLLVELGADPLLPNADGTTPLMVAAGVGTKSPGEDPGTESEALAAVKLAIELGGDVNGVDRNGETPVHGAAYKTASSSVRYLIDHGAKIDVWNRKNKSGWTPLRIAEGVYIEGNLRSASPAVAAILRETMVQAGMSTDVEPLNENFDRGEPRTVNRVSGSK
jgi:ankyrin repeat protein